MKFLHLLPIVALLAAQPAAERPRSREIDHVTAFARLYGVVRYFYPSDAAAALDWDRVAVLGVDQVRAAPDAAALQTVLEGLFTPLGPGIEIGRTLPPALPPGPADESLVAWRYRGPALGGTVPGPYAAGRTGRAAGTSSSIDGFVTVMQSLPAGDLRGRPVRLRGRARAATNDPSGWAALWLRVDRPGGTMGFFDNMGDRPIRRADWHEYVIEGEVADDAVAVAFGVMASGPVEADFDAIEFAVRGADGSWTSVPIADPGFEEAKAGGWGRAGTSKTASIGRPRRDAPEGRQFLRFSPQSSAAGAANLFDAVPIAGAHADVDLGSGLRARVPLALSDSDASASAKGSASLSALRARLDGVAAPGGDPDVNTRLAGVVVAWNVFRHFYPYWPETGVDWDARLGPQLTLAYAANTRAAQRDVLRRLVADARDGHGTVRDTRDTEPPGSLPLRLAMIGGSIVITASAAPAEAPVGGVLTAIDGTPAADRAAAVTQLVSGTPQWKTAAALREITSCRKGTAVRLTLDAGSGPREVALTCEAGQQPPVEKRPDAISELTPSVWYVDLTRTSMAQVTPRLETFARATGLVLDVRGYPTDAGVMLLPHLLQEAESDRWMHMARLTGPFGQSAGWESLGWDLKPVTPRIGGTVVFLTDGRAISYAESVLGYVRDRKLGTIVGDTTAGTNGNVTACAVPGGFQIAFTGMRVTRHDGQSPFHLIGVAPDVRVTPTLSGIREGRDEVLERALEVIRRK